MSHGTAAPATDALLQERRNPLSGACFRFAELMLSAATRSRSALVGAMSIAGAVLDEALSREFLKTVAKLWRSSTSLNGCYGHKLLGGCSKVSNETRKLWRRSRSTARRKDRVTRSG